MHSKRSSRLSERAKRRRFIVAWFSVVSLGLAAVACPSGGQLQDSDRWIAEGCDAPKVVFETNCAGGFCHEAEDGEPPLGALDLLSPGVEDRILPGGTQATASYPDIEGCPATPEPILDVNNVDNSLMMKKLLDEQTCGDRMPPARLSADEIDCVRRWLVSISTGTGTGTNTGSAGSNAGGGGAQ